MEETLPRLVSAAHQVITRSDYQWDNARRQDGPAAILQLTLKGECVFYHEAKRVHVGADYAFLCQYPEQSRYGYPESATTPYNQQYVTIKGGVAQDMAQALRREHGSVYHLPLASEARLLMNEMMERFGKARFRDRFHEAELCTRLLLSLGRARIHELESVDRLAYAYEYLRDHHRAPLNIKGVAETLGFSREHFTRSFRVRFRESPAAYLRRLRLASAESALTHSEAPLDAVARAVGLLDAATLCRYFRQAHACTPQAFRQRSRRQNAAKDDASLP